MRNPKILVLDQDSGLGEQITRVAGELRPRPEVVPCERATSVEDVVSQQGPFDVMVAGPSLGTKAGLSRVQLIHDELPSMSVLLAFDHRPDAQLRDIIRTGAVDLLQLPVADRALHDAVERAVALSRPAASPAPLTAPSAEAPPSGSVFTVASATGGCGKTFLATNLAYYLHHYTG